MPWLTTVLVMPLGAAILLQAVPARATRAIKAVTVLATLAVAAITAGLLVAFQQNPSPSAQSPITMQFQERQDWIPGLGASYHVGIDGLSGWLLALDAAVFLLGAVVMSRRDTERLRFYSVLLLLTQAATVGVLISLDLLLFYVFWEAMLVPLYFLLSNYGDRTRGRATLKFIIYTAAGSLLMLIAIILLYINRVPNQGTGTPSFDFLTMLATPPAGGFADHISFAGVTTLSAQECAFIFFVMAFAIKIPIVPFHTWLPDSYAAAPPQALTFFAGIVSKMGAYGLIRYGLTLFGTAPHTFQYLLEALALLSIVYGALLALGQTDIKRIVAYASISHLGFIVLGIFALNDNGVNGAIIQMVNHGVIIAAMFLVVGMIEQRTGTRDINQLAGLEKRMPWLYALFLVITLAGLGMPGMNTFVGEFTVMLGSFQLNPALPAVASVGVVLACWYMLRLHQGLVHGTPRPATEAVADLRISERTVLLPLAGLMLLIGAYPKPIGDISRSAATQYVAASAQSAVQQAGTPGPAVGSVRAP